MIDKIEENNHENQLLISFELICLIKWILENEDEKIKKIIVRALNSGLQEDINKKTSLSKEVIINDIQSVFFDFFDMMEDILMESISEHAIKKVIERNLMPSIDKIDSSICDDETLRFSIEKTASKLENKYTDNNNRNSSKNSINTKDIGLKESFSAAKSKEASSKENAKRILMTELLKNWKPKEKNILN